MFKKVLYAVLLIGSVFTAGYAEIPSPRQDPSHIPTHSQAKEETESPPSQAVAVDSYENAFMKMLLTLALLLALIFLTVWLLRRLSKGRLLGGMHSSLSVKILERRNLSPKSTLYLVEVSGKKVLIAESQVEVRALTTIDETQHFTPN